MLDYLKTARKAIKPKFTFSAKNEGQWKKWQNDLRAKLTELLGGFPETKHPLKPVIVKKEKKDGYTQEKVVFESEPGVSVPAYLLIPDGVKRNNKALLCLHGHGRGKVDIVGETKNLIEYQQSIRPLNYDYARQFAKRGYVVLAPDARCFGERSAIPCTWAYTSGLLMGKILVGMRVWDAMRAIDYMQTRREVDPDRIGCVGLSWGGTHTSYTSALDDRIKVAVVSGYFSSFEDILIDRGCCPCQYVPNILHYADFPDVISLIAPRPLLIENGIDDPLYTYEVVAEEYKKVQKVYDVLKIPDKVDIDMFKGDHKFSGAKAFDWFEKWLC